MKLYTAQQVADKLGCQKATVHRWARKLKACGIMLGQQRVFTRLDVAAIKRNLKPEPGNPNWRKNASRDP